MKRKAPKITPLHRVSGPKTTKKDAKKHARTTRKEQKASLRFLVGTLSATRQTLSRIARGYYEGWISERESRTLCYLLGTIGRMYVTEKELAIEERLNALEQAARNQGRAGR